MTLSAAETATAGPFSLDDADAYRRWRDRKLERRPAGAGDLMVEIADPLNVTESERAALLTRLRAWNMAVYVCARPDTEPQGAIRSIGGLFGLHHLDAHLCAEEDRITALSTVESGRRKRYIPYTDRPINWHTDGYYNEPRERVRAFMLHCRRQAPSGGESSVMDPEMAYIRLREANPAFIAALTHPQAMTIPPNEEDGETIRGARTGPVFFVDPADGTLGMRYTARGRNIEWRDDPATAAAVAFLRQIMEPGAEDVLRHRMAPGEGLICNNVLHKREGFADGDSEETRRLMFRARYHDRAAGTSFAESNAD